jgi:ABC-type polysaccharide/polyol phosphate transport system ATPase subunit
MGNRRADLGHIPMINAIEVTSVTKTFQRLRRESSIKSAMIKWVRLQFPRREAFTALDNISFNVPPGQTVGVVGRNGSGKSTLLSLLARIYRPTQGRIVVRGRMATLLELGAGFNDEFTGRENIFLNGVIMGLTHEELETRLDDIITFADIGDYIDTPVKHYSLGMKARLGFSIAAHASPDVLLVDEVLAVGDAEFQEKCFAKIEAFKKQGVTIFFVSHDIHAVRRVADRILWIDNHVLRADGPAERVLAEYQG